MVHFVAPQLKMGQVSCAILYKCCPVTLLQLPGNLPQTIVISEAVL